MDVIGIAKTGSGKTLAYAIPMLTHILQMPKLNPREGPRALILVPTRELAKQVAAVVKKLAKKIPVR